MLRDLLQFCSFVYLNREQMRTCSGNDRDEENTCAVLMPHTSP